jgi:hypothetical protein
MSWNKSNEDGFVTRKQCKYCQTVGTLEFTFGRSQWLRSLNRGSAAVRFLGLRVRIAQGAWMFISCECCVMSGRGLCVGLITRPEESYRACRVLTECDSEASIMRRLWLTRGCWGCCAKKRSHLYVRNGSEWIWHIVIHVQGGPKWMGRFRTTLFNKQEKLQLWTDFS